MKKSVPIIIFALGLAAALQPAVPPRSSPRRTSWHRTTGASRTPLLTASSSSSSAPMSAGGNIAAGMYSGLATVLDCAAFTSIVFAPLGMPLTIGLQHGLVGFVLMQAVVTRLSGLGFVLAPTSYEVIP